MSVMRAARALIEWHMPARLRLIALLLSLATTELTDPSAGIAAEPIYRSLPATKTPTARDLMRLPAYRDGEAIRLRLGGRFAYLIQPRGKVDSTKRWVWIFPFEHALASAGGGVEHQFYVDALLAKGFHVAGIDIGVACGSPRGAECCQQFYALLVGKYGLNPRASAGAKQWRLECLRVGRAAPGLCRSPGRDLSGDRLAVVARVGEGNRVSDEGIGIELTQDQLATRLAEFNPIENLPPLAKAGVKLLQLHGDRDQVVPLVANSSELARRYRGLGGAAEVIVIRGYGHGGRPFSAANALAEFLLAD